jgi:hypothetical protein
MVDRGLAAAENMPPTGPVGGFGATGSAGGSWARLRAIGGLTPGIEAAEGRPTPIDDEGTVGEGNVEDG